jgi:hypothetical protein
MKSHEKKTRAKKERKIKGDKNQIKKEKRQ